MTFVIWIIVILILSEIPWKGEDRQVKRIPTKEEKELFNRLVKERQQKKEIKQHLRIKNLK